MQQTSAIRQYKHSWHTAAADPSDSENKGGAQNLWCQIWEAFSSHKTKSVLPPTPDLLIVQRLDSSRKLLLLSQIFHGAACWLKAAAAACYAEVCAKESELLEYLAVRLPCQYIVVVSRMYRSKMYKLFFPRDLELMYLQVRSFELLRCLVGRLSLLESSRLEFTLE